MSSNKSIEPISSEIKACVSLKPDGRQCAVNPCNHGSILAKSDSTTDTEDQIRLFGYAGRFVQREKNIPRAPMQVPGSPRWDSGCVISHKYKFVYIHVLKSGGSALKTFLRQSFCGEDDLQCVHAGKDIIAPIGCSKATKEYPDYFFWSFVRNPFSRMYSMYSMMEGFPRVKHRHVGGSSSSSSSSFENYSFHEFVLHPKERNLYTSMSSSHYVQQTEFLFDRNDCPSMDFLGRLEHFDDDMKVLLAHLRVPEMLSLFRVWGAMREENTWGSNGKKSRLGGDLRNAYRSQEVVDGVTEQYSRDFDLLGYDTIKSAIPQK